MDAEPSRCTLQDAKSQEVLHGRAMLRPHREAPGTKRIGKRSAPVTHQLRLRAGLGEMHRERDRKSTRLNSSHGYISYAVFCLKKKNYMSYAVSCSEAELYASHHSIDR